ncbi:MAG: hypothetical protein ACD_4C00139G0002, partial [uncultured bacterium (gcode 4)]
EPLASKALYKLRKLTEGKDNKSIVEALKEAIKIFGHATGQQKLFFNNVIGKNDAYKQGLKELIKNDKDSEEFKKMRL